MITSPKSPYLTLQNLKYENQVYWDMMDPDQGMDPIVQILVEKVSWGSVFEYGAGRGRNAIPLAQRWYRVHAQDIARAPLEDLQKRVTDGRLDIVITESDASQHILTQDYDALICLRVLHFLEREDALRVVFHMQEHTNIGWLNALVLFLDQSPHGATEYVNDPFFPSVVEILDLYTGWEILFQEVTESPQGVTPSGKPMVRLSLLVQKRGE